MRLNDFRIKAFLILVYAVCLCVTGCGNAAADYEGAATEEAEVISEVESDDVSEDDSEYGLEDIHASAKNNEDIGSQLHLIADNYDLLYETAFSDDFAPPASIAITDLNHNGRLEVIISSCEGSGAFSSTCFYEISEDFSSLDSLIYNDEPTPGQAGDFLLSDLYVDNQYDYTVYDCYKKNDEYYYLIKDYMSQGWSEKYLAYYSYSIGEGVTEDLIGVCMVYPDSDYDTLTVHTRLYKPNFGFNDKESYLTYMGLYWWGYEKQSSCAVKWKNFTEDDNFFETIKESFEAFDPDYGYVDVIDYDYEKYFGSFYSDYEFVVEEKLDIDHSINDEVDVEVSMKDYEGEIPFDVIYADFDLKSYTGWDSIFRYERYRYSGKVYEFILSHKLLENHDYTVEGLLVITEEDDKGNYQIIEHDTPTTNPIPARTLYFIDVTYDGTPEVLIDYGGFGAQNCTYMGCYRYDALADEYVEVPGFAGISNPEVDTEGEYIFGFHRDASFMHSYYVYQYKNDRFEEVYHLVSTYEDGEHVWLVNNIEICRSAVDDYSLIDNPVFEMFYLEDGSINPRGVRFKTEDDIYLGF